MTDQSSNFQNTQPQTTTATGEDRSPLLREVVTVGMEAAHGVQKMSDQQISQILGGLVRTKLLSADDSYRLRDRLLDMDTFQRTVEQRIEASLKRNGLVTEKAFEDMKTRLQTLEAQA